jgi:hypothetical protein
VQSQTITFGGATLGTFAATPSGLTITLGTNNVTSAMLTALLREISFATDDTKTASRTVQVDLNYGGIRVSANRTLQLDRPPVAHDLEILAIKGVNVTVAFSDLLNNATDPDHDTINLTGVSIVSGNGGRVTTNGSSLTYRPPANHTANSDSIGYVIDDGRGGETVGVIVITFIAQNEITIDASDLNTTGTEITMGGAPGRLYDVQVSTDLVNWSLLESVLATPTGIISVLDADAKNCPQRFYRAVAK